MNKTKQIMIMGLAVLGACKEKNVVTSPTYMPDRSDYVIAANQAYLLASDSAAKQTSRFVQDSASFPINYSPPAMTRFQLFSSLGKQGLVRAFDNQVRDILAENIRDLHIPASDFMRITEHDIPQNFLKQKILIQRYLEPQRDSLKRMVLRNVSKQFLGSRAHTIWLQGNTLYNQYYSTNQVMEFEFEPIVDKAVYQFIKNASNQEDSVKANYKNWENKQAAKAMRYVLKH